MYLLTVAGVAALASLCLASPGYLKLDVHRSSFQTHLARRDGSLNAPLTQNADQLEYMINITIGTPPQSLAVTLDTGSSDLWVPAASSHFCEKGNCDDGTFNSKESSTYTLIEKGGFTINYEAPGDSDAGDWAADTVTVGGSPSIQQQQIGVGTSLADPHGVMGIGYDTNEATNNSPNGVYLTVLDNMKAAGVINRKAYSLYLNDLRSTKGAIIFGGVDTTKYTGDLVALPLQPGSEGAVSEFYVTLTRVSFTDETGTTTQLSAQGYAQSVLLDSGTSDTLLTDDVFAALANGFGAVDVGQDEYVVPCRFAGINGTINYSFGGEGGVTVSVPVSQIIGSVQYTPDGFADESGGCDFGIGPPLGGFSIMGDTFLRSAYAVFDIDNNMAALAQAVMNQTDTSSIVVIPTGTAIPGASVTATAVGTQVPDIQATAQPAVPSASSRSSSMLLAGTPTFNIGIASTAGTGAGTATSSGGANAAAPTAALLGLGLAAGIMAI